MTGREAIAQFWQAGIDAGVEAIVLNVLEVDVEPDGEAAYEIGSYVLRLQQAAGDPIVDRGRYVLVYRRQPDGRWQRAVETINPHLPLAAAASSG